MLTGEVIIKIIKKAHNETGCSVKKDNVGENGRQQLEKETDGKKHSRK